jgi:hypothetical protein
VTRPGASSIVWYHWRSSAPAVVVAWASTPRPYQLPERALPVASARSADHQVQRVADPISMLTTANEHSRPKPA